MYAIPLYDLFDESASITTPEWIARAAVPHMWDAEIGAALGVDRMEAIRVRCRQLHGRVATSDDVGLVDAAHALLDSELYERVIRLRIPGMRAVGDGIVFTVPGASPDLPANDGDVVRMVRMVRDILCHDSEAAEGSPGLGSTIRVLAVAPGMVEVVEAIVRADEPSAKAAWAALDPAARAAFPPELEELAGSRLMARLRGWC